MTLTGGSIPVVGLHHGGHWWGSFWEGPWLPLVSWGHGLALFHLGNKEVGDARAEGLGTSVICLQSNVKKENRACDIYISQHGWGVSWEGSLRN